MDIEWYLGTWICSLSSKWAHNDSIFEIDISHLIGGKEYRLIL
jgi:hypothetical protein